MKQEIKVAVIVSSRYRKYSEVCLDIFNKYFNYSDDEIDVKADFFVYTHEKTCDLNFDKTKFSQNLLTSEDINNINNILKPKKLVIETNYDNIKSKVENYQDDKFVFWCANEKYNNDFQRLYQYHSFEEGVKLMEQYEIENNISYDLVFKLRPDLFLDLNNHYNGLIFKYPFNWENNFKELQNKDARWADSYRLTNTIFAHDISIVNGRPKMCDTTFLGSSNSIKLFTKDFTKQIIENMLFVYNTYINNESLRDCLLTPESVITGHIIEKQFTLISIPCSVYSAVCIRSNYINGSTFGEVCRLYNEFWQGERNRLLK